tara:strand:+ start:13985 stop:16348 length:2364 start_codon:yes stop_codon:yes gene_type:complete
MADKNSKLELLEMKLDMLIKKQHRLDSDIQFLSSQIRSLSDEEKESVETPATEEHIPEEVSLHEFNETEELENAITQEIPKEKESEPSSEILPGRVDWEKVIGENIINKIGIIITVIGVGIGANYVIEHDLISPAMRIMLGYLFSFGLLGVAYRLRKKYLNYSSVLMGGGMASMYLLTFAAYNFYALIPQIVAFGVMVVLTLITVALSIGYDREWISVFGQVGGYAVPFLLGDETGSTLVLFSYVLLLNVGILWVALQKYWRILYYSAFVFTWLIFLTWFTNEPAADRDVAMSFLFSTLYFLIFYAAFLGYKVRTQLSFSSLDISTLLTNTSLYFGIGYVALEADHSHIHGLFTIIVAAIHLVVGQILQRVPLPSPAIKNFVNGLVLVFITLAIPIQFQDRWITMAWSMEALLLFWLGRTKAMKVFEVLSYPLLVLSYLSLLMYYFEFELFTMGGTPAPLLNSFFGTFIVFWAAFAGIHYIQLHYQNSALPERSLILKFTRLGVPFVLIITLYFVLLTEISHAFEWWRDNTEITQTVTDSFYGSRKVSDPAISSFKRLWMINYSILFLIAGSFVNNRFSKSDFINRSILIFSLIFLYVVLATFFGDIKTLRELYLGTLDGKGFDQGISNILIRYVVIAFASAMVFKIRDLLTFAKTIRQPVIFFETLLAFLGVFLASSELIQWLDLAGFENSYKLGLSVLWGISSLILILIGMFKRKVHLRIEAMILFSATLFKLFFYDISHLSTISKTIVFLSLGILLLIISYFYNRFKDRIYEEEESEIVNSSAH